MPRAAAAALLAFAVCAACPSIFGAQNAANGLPDRDTFLQDVRESLARSQQAFYRYAYKERRTDIHTNPFGRLGTGDTRLSQVYPSPNPQLTYRRTIERNGYPVSQRELDQQEREYRAKVAEVERRIAREDDDDRERRGRDELLARRRAQMLVDDVVGTLQFEIARREMRDDVQTIVVTFVSRPDARPVTREGRIAKVFKGTAWVHEAAREVMHVEAVATEDVSFGGFIAKLYEGTEATVHRQEIEPGVWMPSRVKLGGEARALFRKFTIDFEVEWFDYRRLDELTSRLDARIQQ